MATAKEAFELAMGALRAADFDVAPKVNDGALENPPQHLDVSMVGFKPGEIGQYPFIDMLDSQFSQPIKVCRKATDPFRIRGIGSAGEFVPGELQNHEHFFST
jgi:hypothetical protein